MLSTFAKLIVKGHEHGSLLRAVVGRSRESSRAILAPKRDQNKPRVATKGPAGDYDARKQRKRREKAKQKPDKVGAPRPRRRGTVSEAP